MAVNNQICFAVLSIGPWYNLHDLFLKKYSMLNLNDQLFNKPIHRKNIISIELVEDFEVVYSFRKLHYYIMA